VSPISSDGLQQKATRSPSQAKGTNAQAVMSGAGNTSHAGASQSSKMLNLQNPALSSGTSGSHAVTNMPASSGVRNTTHGAGATENSRMLNLQNSTRTSANPAHTGQNVPGTHSQTGAASKTNSASGRITGFGGTPIGATGNKTTRSEVQPQASGAPKGSGPSGQTRSASLKQNGSLAKQTQPSRFQGNPSKAGKPQAGGRGPSQTGRGRSH
jgi:hypothetical protein